MTTSDQPVTVLLISGGAGPGSANTAALRTAAELEIPGVVATLWERLRDIPAFVPEDPAEAPAAVTELQRLLTEADTVLFCTPEYAGTLPGNLKNAIDWLVGGRGGFYRKPVASTTSRLPAAAPAPKQRCRRSSATSTPTSSSRRACGSRSPGT